MKLLKNKIVLLVLGLVGGAGAMFGAYVMLGDMMPGAPKAAAKPEPPKVGMMYPLKERIVNLADPGVMRYLKTTVVLEVVDHSGKPPPKGEEYKKKQDELVKEMKGEQPIIEDVIMQTLASKTAGELMSGEGKQKLKDELKTKLNKALAGKDGGKDHKDSKDSKDHHKTEVLSVYFSDFIIQ